jgi:hypothetical protein
MSVDGSALTARPADPAGTACPEAGAATLDLSHLGRMTFGDRGLESEVLQLFDRQAAMLAERLGGATATIAGCHAHTIKGAARGVGAWRLALAAEQVEAAARSGGPELAGAVAQLIAAIGETRSVVARHLRRG